MSTQSRQLMRLTKFIEELKMNNYPTVPHMLKILRDADINEGMPCSCSERTFRRDIDTLRNDYQAPIQFDPVKQGYYLTDPTWQFDVPVFSTPKVKACVDPNVLRILLDANRAHRVVNLTYARPNEKAEARTFEPHVITLFNGVWYVRGKKQPNGETRTYAVQRISTATITDTPFTLDKRLVADTKRNGPFDLEKISGIVLQVEDRGAFYFHEREKSEGYTIQKQKNGSSLIQLPPMTEINAVRFVLGGLGAARVVKPTALRRRVLTFAQDILKVND